MQSFKFETLPYHVLFGVDTLHNLPAEVDRLQLTRVLVLSTRNHRHLAERVRDILDDRVAGLFCEAVMHTPVDVTTRAVEFADRLHADGVVAIGGGSTIGLGKAIALRTQLPQIAVPTTYAGSEMTPVLGETENGVKTTIRNPRLLPQSVIYDVNLTLGLPVDVSIPSGLNAMAHAVEALYAADANPITSLLADEGIRSLLEALPAIRDNPADSEARSQALYGAWLCGTCLAQAGMGIHHKLCHILGGSFGLPHAETHSVILPHAIAYNLPAAPAAMARLSGILARPGNPAAAMHEFCRRLGAPLSLRDLGMPESGIAIAARQAGSNVYPNPRPIEIPAVEQLIRRAWAGETPQT